MISSNGRSISWRVEAAGLGFLEGPVLMPDGTVCFSDETDGRVLRVRDGSDVVDVVCTTTGSFNGLAVGPDAALYAADNGGMRPLRQGGWGPMGSGDGHVARISADGSVTRWTDELAGQAPHRLNDLCFDLRGTLWVTDSGNWEAMLASSPQGYRGGAIFRCDSDGRSRRVAEVPDFPNGIAVTLDGAGLLVAHTTSSSLWVYPFAGDGLGAPELFADLSAIGRFGPDGLVVLDDGSVLVAGNHAESVAWVSPDGEVLDLLRTPDGWGPTNVALAPGRLFVTMGAGGRLCSVEGPWRPAVPGR